MEISTSALNDHDREIAVYVPSPGMLDNTTEEYHSSICKSLLLFSDVGLIVANGEGSPRKLENETYKGIDFGPKQHCKANSYPSHKQDCELDTFSNHDTYIDVEVSDKENIDRRIYMKLSNICQPNTIYNRSYIPDLETDFASFTNVLEQKHHENDQATCSFDDSWSADGSYFCRFENCGRIFPSKSRLQRHQMIHTGEKPYQCLCDGCEKRFSRHDNMLQHYRTHLVKVKRGRRPINARLPQQRS